MWVWPKAREREAGKQNWRRERENGKKKNYGPSNGNKPGPTHEFSPDLNPDWI